MLCIFSCAYWASYIHVIFVSNMVGKDTSYQGRGQLRKDGLLPYTKAPSTSTTPSTSTILSTSTPFPPPPPHKQSHIQQFLVLLNVGLSHHWVFLHHHHLRHLCHSLCLWLLLAYPHLAYNRVEMPYSNNHILLLQGVLTLDMTGSPSK